MTQSTRTIRPLKPQPIPDGGRNTLSVIAFLLLLAVVVARMLMSETIRSPGEAFPGQEAPPAAPGAATGLVLDLIAWLPAMLALASRAMDRNQRLRWSWACVPMLLLGLWAVISISWSSDRFAAAVSSFHWLSALVLLWSAAQWVTCWRRIRLVAGACLGMLLVLVITGYSFRLSEWPDLKRTWSEHREEVMKEHHWQRDSFDMLQFEKRIMSGEILGFSTSPNTYAALLVLLGIIAAGIAAQKLSESRQTSADRVAAGAVALILLAALPALLWAGSRGAAATAVLGAILLGALFMGRRRIAAASRAIYWTGVCGFVLACLLITSHGLYHHSLLHASLTFRWRYWVGASRLIALHPLHGVGWENFGPTYLAVRLPIASEEVRDPHNFIVRIASELGFVGAILLLSWMLRLWWEMTQLPEKGGNALPNPVGNPQTPRVTRSTQAVIWISALALAATLINLLLAVDFNAPGSFVFLECMRRALFLGCLVGGLCLVALMPATQALSKAASGELQFEIDDRPAPWVLISMIVGLGMFLVHNLIDFAIFEPGPMFLFALLAGSILGIRSAQPAPKVCWTSAIGFFFLSIAAWITAAIWLAIPVAEAEGLVHDAEDAIRGRHPRAAADDFFHAFERVPWNGEYAYRAALAARAAGDNPTAVQKLLNAAIAADPSSVSFLIARAEYCRETGPKELSLIAKDYQRASRLDPNNVKLHLQLARVYEQMGNRAEADAQLKAAIDANEGLDPAEPKRLKPIEVRAIRSEIEHLWLP